jgi:hypothetical protein
MGRRTVTITITDDIADLLDAIALVEGHKKRAGVARHALYQYALDRADDPGVRQLVRTRVEHAARERRAHLQLVVGGAG